MRSTQWDNITQRLAPRDGFSIDSFLRTSKYMMYGTFDPKRFGELYLKALTYQLYQASSPRCHELLRAIRNTKIGNPYAIECDGIFV